MQFGLNHDHNIQSPDYKSTEENSSPTDLQGSMSLPNLYHIQGNFLI